MKLLLDTHALLWWLLESPRLSLPAKAAIAGADEVYVSAVSAFEIATKVRIGKLEEAHPILDDFSSILVAGDFLPLPVTSAHALVAGRLEGAHRDPFDRLLAAQALADNLALVTCDPALAMFGVRTRW